MEDYVGIAKVPNTIPDSARAAEFSRYVSDLLHPRVTFL